eukprot:scaffold1752_cov188-Amphora_coffeaeformis.AAC.11
MSTVPGLSFRETLEALRRIINNGTATLAVGGLLDEGTTEGLAWALQTTVAQAYAAFQENPPPSLATEDFGEEGVTIAPLILEGVAIQEANPLLFSSPFLVAPFKEDPAESHLIIVCAVAAFNLGLAMHSQSFVASKDKDQDRRLLLQAKEFYMQAHDLMDKLEVMLPDGTWIQVFLATCNNMAEISAQLNIPAEVNEWQEALQHCFWTVPPMKKSPVYRHFSDVSVAYGMEFEHVPEYFDAP